MRSLLEIYESINDDDEKITKRDEKMLFYQCVADALKKKLDIDSSAFPAGKDSDVLPFASISDFEGERYRDVNLKMEKLINDLTKEMRRHKIKLVYTTKTEDRAMGRQIFTEKYYNITFYHTIKRDFEVTFTLKNIFSAEYISGPTDAILTCSSTVLYSPNNEIKDII